MTGTRGAATGPRVEACRGLAAEWELLERGVPLIGTARWLRTTEGRVPGEPRTFVLRERGEPVAAAYGAVVEQGDGGLEDLYHLLVGRALAGDGEGRGAPRPRPEPLAAGVPGTRAGDAPGAWRAAAAAAPGPAAWFPNLVLMFPGYACFPVGPAAGSPAHVAALVDGVVAWAAAAGLRAVAFLYPPPAAAALVEAVRAAGFARAPVSDETVLPLRGERFDDYLAALSGHRRANVRRDLRLLEAAGVTLEVRQLADCVDELVPLRCATQRRYRGHANPAAQRERLAAFASGLPRDEVQVHCAVADGRLARFTLLFTGEETWWCWWTGADYGHPKLAETYFGTVFYSPIRAALERGARAIHYGQASVTAKLARGCKLVPMDAWVLALDPGLAPTVAACEQADRGI